MTTTTLAGAERPPARLDGAAARGMAEPTALGWLKDMAAVLGPEHALAAWGQATAATGAHGMALTLDQLQAVGQWIVDSTTDVSVRMAARTCLVRLRTYRVLTGMETT